MHSEVLERSKFDFQLIKLAALKGAPIFIADMDLLNEFTLSIVHDAEEIKKVLYRLRKAA